MIEISVLRMRMLLGCSRAYDFGTFLKLAEQLKIYDPNRPRASVEFLKLCVSFLNLEGRQALTSAKRDWLKEHAANVLERLNDLLLSTHLFENGEFVGDVGRDLPPNAAALFVAFALDEFSAVTFPQPLFAYLLRASVSRGGAQFGGVMAALTLFLGDARVRGELSQHDLDVLMTAMVASKRPWSYEVLTCVFLLSAYVKVKDHLQWSEEGLRCILGEVLENNAVWERAPAILHLLDFIILSLGSSPGELSKYRGLLAKRLKGLSSMLLGLKHSEVQRFCECLEALQKVEGFPSVPLLASDYSGDLFSVLNALAQNKNGGLNLKKARRVLSCYVLELAQTLLQGPQKMATFSTPRLYQRLSEALSQPVPDVKQVARCLRLVSQRSLKAPQVKRLLHVLRVLLLQGRLPAGAIDKQAMRDHMDVLERSSIEDASELLGVAWSVGLLCAAGYFSDRLGRRWVRFCQARIDGRTLSSAQAYDWVVSLGMVGLPEGGAVVLSRGLLEATVAHSMGIDVSSRHPVELSQVLRMWACLAEVSSVFRVSQEVVAVRVARLLEGPVGSHHVTALRNVLRLSVSGRIGPVCVGPWLSLLSAWKGWSARHVAGLLEGLSDALMVGCVEDSVGVGVQRQVLRWVAQVVADKRVTLTYLHWLSCSARRGGVSSEVGCMDEVLRLLEGFLCARPTARHCLSALASLSTLARYHDYFKEDRLLEATMDVMGLVRLERLDSHQVKQLVIALYHLHRCWGLVFSSQALPEAVEAETVLQACLEALHEAAASESLVKVVCAP